MVEKNKVSGVITGGSNYELPTHFNYGTYTLEKIAKSKNKVALINGVTDEKKTYGEMYQEIINVASALAKIGFRKGDVVAICSENRPEFVISAIAALCSGAVLTFINSGYSKGELIHTMGISKPKHIFMSPATYDNYYNIIKDNTTVSTYIVFGKVNKTNAVSYENLASNYTDPRSFAPVDYKGRSGTALILYSSGTTGLPKGVKLTHSGLIIAGMQTTPNQRGLNVLSIAPLSNTVGYINTIRELCNGNTCIYLAKFKEPDYLRAIQTHKAGYLLVVPPLVVILTKSSILDNYDVSSVQYMYSGGAPLDWSVILQAKKRFPNLKHILQGYGMTEATGVITEEFEDRYRNGSVGRIPMGITIKVVDIETRKILGPNQQGEICIKGPVLFEGFIGKDMSEDFDEDGFYKTGDIAYYDEDGYFFITDRLKELIKYNAWQVAPSELEGIMLKHPKIKDVGVIGIPDAKSGEVPLAFVVKKPSVQLTEKEVIDYVASEVSPWKQLRGGVRFVDEIPKNGSGKILRRILRDSLTKLPQSKL